MTCLMGKPVLYGILSRRSEYETEKDFESKMEQSYESDTVRRQVAKL